MKESKKVGTQRQRAGGKSWANGRDLGTFTEDRQQAEAFMWMAEQKQPQHKVLEKHLSSGRQE